MAYTTGHTIIAIGVGVAFDFPGDPQNYRYGAIFTHDGVKYRVTNVRNGSSFVTTVMIEKVNEDD